MRGIIRRMINIDGIFWIFILSALWLVVYIVFLPSADAISRTEYDDLKAKKVAAQDKLLDYDIQLDVQRELIAANNDKLADLKAILKTVNDLSDWESLRLKLEYNNAVQTTNNYSKELRDGLGDIITNKSDTIKFLKSLNLNDVTIDHPTSLSHLTPRIGVSLSKSCEIMIKNGFESNCPTYKELLQLDSSNTDISGKFTTDDDGFFHRGEESVVNSYKFYWNDSTIRIFVDPPHNMAERIKMIYIQPNFDTYTIANDMTVPNEFEVVQGNRTITYGNNSKILTFDNRIQTEYFGTVQYHDRYIEKCRIATINANEWKFLIGDTIHLMRNNCDRSFTGFEEREVILPEYSEIDVTTSPNWLYLQAQKHIEEFCIFKYKQCS